MWRETPAPTTTELFRFPLYSEEFAADPHRVYAEMRRRYGSLVPVELSPGIPATLVIGYSTAVRISNDEAHFPADPRAWQKDVPNDCPVKPMMEYRPNALRSSGQEHRRFRKASVDGIEAINLFSLHNDIEQIAIPLINDFCGDGEADLLGQYAFPLTFAVLNSMVGCPADIGQQVAQGMAMMFEGNAAEEGNALFVAALAQLVALKRSQPGDDVTTRLVNHSAQLTDEELVHQLVTIYGAGIEPLTNLITNTLLLMLSDDRFSGFPALTTRDALNELLFKDPPLANFGITYPAQPILIDETWLPAKQPVVTSMAACNNDPAIVGEFTDNNSHLAWGTGPHTCPAQDVAYPVAQNAIDQLLDALPEMALACPPDQLTWRPGPFHRSLAALPVRFTPSPPLNFR
ncbi:cytochrome P450 [Nocardia cyriacigeorgica]|uniref:Cytochrome P450 n=1 Tax=Nocardia cyriacigeorgica TaxID=135487 RepID=A0A6P1CEI6_9NOCA|nr:cytochrome P450 [Nocardia cyriacigeorgica]MBF6081010.1 cytochrome P450 [Nocardia cyriacigeorgica]MBF6284893.1 cytochrome P450 [Nocardia cyriacigeorgica]NEW31031.1 cytochrome P450 [Nocardia cyriacigeorgica]